MKKLRCFLLLLLFVSIYSCNSPKETVRKFDNLSYWNNDSNVKTKIQTYLNDINKDGRQNIPTSMRTAIVDVENLYINLSTDDIMRKITAKGIIRLAHKNPILVEHSPYKEILNNDDTFIKTYDYRQYVHLYASSYAGEDIKIIKADIQTALQEIYTENPNGIFSKPILQLINLLEENDFKIYYKSKIEKLTTSLLLNEKISNVLAPYFELKFSENEMSYIRTPRFTDDNVDSTDFNTFFEEINGVPPMVLITNQKVKEAYTKYMHNYNEKSKIIYIAEKNSEDEELTFLTENLQWICAKKNRDFQNVFYNK